MLLIKKYSYKVVITWLIIMKEYLVNNLDNILAYIFGAGGFFSWYSERKRRKIDAFSVMQTSYDKYVEDSDKKFEEMKKEIAYFQTKLEKVEEHWRKKYNALKKEFDIYKKTHP